jgi:hypothetical protein
MSGKTRVILGFHAHLPPGPWDAEFEELYSAVLKPLVTALNSRPDIHAVLHFSGPLLEKLEQKKREIFLLIGDLVSRRQIELLGGGFYEPPLSLLPLADKIGQIEMFTTYVRRRFGKKPQGCCLPFGVWEESFAGLLNSCGMLYTFLDAAQFRAAGIDGEELFVPWITEDQGKLITVFPVFSSLEEIPVSGGKGERLAAAVFPRFSRENREENVTDFFDVLSRGLEEKRFELCLPGKVLRLLGGTLKRTYFPGSPSAAFSPRRFLTRHAEANGIYSKMYFVHTLINQLRGDKSRKQAAREELWKAQRADIFSRGGDETLTFGPGGDIACHETRHSVYRALLSSEKITKEKGNCPPPLLAFDFDLDGQPEYLLQDKNINCYIRTSGASLFELDYLPKAWNYLDTFSPSGGRRSAFMDRLFDAGLSPFALDGVSGESAVRLCADEMYDAAADKARGRAVFTLAPHKDRPFGGIEIEKSYQLEKNVLSVSYTLTNRGGAAAFSFAPQIDFSFAGPKHFSVCCSDPAAAEALAPSQENPAASGVRAFTITDTKNKAVLGLSSDAAFTLFFFNNIADRGTSGENSHEIYESTSFLPVFHLNLENGESWSTVFKLSVSPAKK